MTNARRILTVLLAFALALVLAPVSPAAAVVTLGKHCEGTRAVRCAWVNHDATNNRVRGYGSVKDTTSGTIGVRVSVTLFSWNSSYDRWEPVSSGGPQSGYEYVQAGTGLVMCRDGQVFMAEAVWEWNGTDSGRVRSSSVTISYC